MKHMAFFLLRSGSVTHSVLFLLSAPVMFTQPGFSHNSAWIHDWEHPLVRRVSIKVRYLSNLTIESAEALHVINYGVAGHNEPHYDFTRHRENDPFGSNKGKRLATVIFYMSDVEAGGATVFTLLGVKLQPEKGSVALWHNLKQNGERNYRMHHAACPVITGSKWVANKWLHERGQEFVYPCDINPKM